MAEPKKKQSFEKGLEALEALVEKLEGELPIEESMKAYEAGVKLHAELSKQLDAHEKKLEALSEEGEA